MLHANLPCALQRSRDQGLTFVVVFVNAHQDQRESRSDHFGDETLELIPWRREAEKTQSLRQGRSILDSDWLPTDINAAGTDNEKYAIQFSQLYMKQLAPTSDVLDFLWRHFR